MSYSLSEIISKTYAIFPGKISFEFNLGNPLPSLVIKYRKGSIFKGQKSFWLTRYLVQFRIQLYALFIDWIQRIVIINEISYSCMNLYSQLNSASAGFAKIPVRLAVKYLQNQQSNNVDKFGDDACFILNSKKKGN